MNKQEKAQDRIEKAKRPLLEQLALCAKGTKQSSVDAASLTLLRDAVLLCLRIGRITPDMVLPSRKKAG